MLAEVHDRCKRVTVPAARTSHQDDAVTIGRTTVLLDEAGKDGMGWMNVYASGILLGRIRKGSYTYSPPMHKGSRVVLYHKQVPEWQADAVDTKGRQIGQTWKGSIGNKKNTRQAAIAYLLLAARSTHEEARWFWWED